MNRILLLLSLTLFGAVSAQAQSASTNDKTQILKVVQQFFDALESRDTAAFNNTSVVDRYAYFIQERSDSVFTGSRSAAKFSERLAASKNVVTEKMREKDVKVEVHKRIAMVWAPYDLWIDKKFSHCGVDVFTLLKTTEGWKIATIAYTMEPEGCN